MLLETLVALAILGIFISSALLRMRAVRDAASLTFGRERHRREASRLLDSLALVPHQRLSAAAGRRYIGHWLCDISPMGDGRVSVVVSDAADGAFVLQATLFRASEETE